MPDQQKDTPGVIVFPPLVPATVLVVGALIDWLAPVGLLNQLPLWPRAIVGGVLFAIALGLALAGERAFHRVGTNVNPLRPSLAVASTGIFAHLRNPMYTGMAFGLAGIVLIFGLEWTLLLSVVGMSVLHFGVVLREERYLERKFGDEYLRYKESVPRYGWKL